MKPSRFVNGIGQKSCRKCKFYKMFTKIKQILRNRKIHRWGGKNLWIMWITWCISAFFSKIKEKQGGQLSTKVLWTTVDKVDNRKIECMVCAICQFTIILHSRRVKAAEWSHPAAGAMDRNMSKLLKKKESIE